MLVEVDPRGRKVVIFGDETGARQAVRRFCDAGATVTLVTETPPGWAERVDTVRYARRPVRTDSAGLLRLIGPAWLVVDVGLPPGLRDRVRELAGHLHLLMITEEPAPAYGQVCLVGGGPGPTDRLTLEACAALRRADVVFHDRSTPTDELVELTGGAELVDVSGPHRHPASPGVISGQLVMRARRGESVVRLTGGDPFALGRGGEELRACVEAGVPVQVVPGLPPAMTASEARAS